jgi:hypothetical protein
MENWAQIGVELVTRQHVAMFVHVGRRLCHRPDMAAIVALLAHSCVRGRVGAARCTLAAAAAIFGSKSGKAAHSV